MTERSGAAGGRLALSLTGDDLPDGDPALARVAEDSGFTDLWSGEVAGPDSVVLITSVAAATRRVRIGTAILNVYSRSPLVLATTAASLQRVSRGRFCLGLGTSTPQLVELWHGHPFEQPLRRAEETLDAVRRLLDGERVTIDGSSLQVSGARLTAPPDAPPAIHLAALGPSMLALAGRLADGLILNLVSPPLVETMVGTALRSRNHDAAFEVMLPLLTPVDGEDPRELELVRRHLTAYTGVAVYRRIFAAAGFSQDGSDQGVSDEMLSELTLVGSREEQFARLAAYRSAGVTTPSLAFSSAAEDRDARREAITDAAGWFGRRWQRSLDEVAGA